MHGKNTTIGFVALKNLPIDTNIDFLALLVTKIELIVTCYIYYGASYTGKCNSNIYVVTDFFVAISKAYYIKESERISIIK